MNVPAADNPRSAAFKQKKNCILDAGRPVNDDLVKSAFQRY